MTDLKKIIQETVAEVLAEETPQERKRRLRKKFALGRTVLDRNTLNPDTEQGRINLSRELIQSIKDLKTRAEILDRQIERAMAAQNRQGYKEQLILMNDSLVSLKKEVATLIKIYLVTVKQYEKQRGRDLPIAVGK